VTALPSCTPLWFVAGLGFDEPAKVLTVCIDFKAGSRFAVEGVAGEHPVHDTVTKTYRHLNFFQHECVLEVRTPRVKLPDGSVHLIKAAFAGKLSGFTLLFEALVLMLAPQMPIAAVARTVGISEHRAWAICRRYVALALDAADFGQVKSLAIDETSRARGHDYITLAADARARRVLSVTEGSDAKAVQAIGPRVGRARLPARENRVGRHRHVAGVHQGLHRALAQRAHHERPSSTSSGTPMPRWTRCGASSSAATSPSRA
jgi:transposase